MRKGKIHVIAILAVGSLIGYVAASGGPNWFSKASASPSEQPRTVQLCSVVETGSCCEGLSKSPFIAGNPAVIAPVAIMAMTPGRQDGEETITFEILVPADAVLELNGTKMDPTGESRKFVTPALKTGGHYSYDVKATSHGKEVTRKIHLGHGVTNSFDLRGDFGGASAAAPTQVAAKPASGKKPNILYIMGDDVGWFNIGAYHRGIMSGKTPNLDKLASQGMLFTDYYAEASCTAGRASFITGEIPLRTGLTTVGQAGADVGMPAQACTIATALKAQGYTTGQFGKNHLGDLNKYLPTLHGFDEFFGYLYHLDAMSDPFWYSFPSDPKFYETYGPRNSFTAGRPRMTTPPRCHAGARSASRRSSTKGLCVPSRT
ncbi:MAG: sulfatase-like hydrolase/transferase [Gemmatales bacterium]